MKLQNQLGPVKYTSRGFPFVEFEDQDRIKCSLQMSSLALCAKPGTSAVLLGINNANPQVLARNADGVGIRTEKTTGWVPYPIPEGVFINTRMHLNREQVSALITHLQNWLDEDKF